MKRIIGFLLAALLIAGAAYAGAPDQAWSYEFKGGTGTLVLTGASFDEAWSASIHLFMTQNTKGLPLTGPPVTLDRPSQTMTGRWVMGKGWKKWLPFMTLLFEERGGRLYIFSTAVAGTGTKKQSEAVGRSFFDALIAKLETDKEAS